ncbi:MAG: sulfide/dihydroorotate dehydrogenase-like FAD/NAD-binding protein [Clostridia bacterium]|nr:sulfide/dihydroorotate dehydrogenase-like FAD/NAD-binding protein [Clostridia bacterium]
MYKIVAKDVLNEQVTRMVIHAPYVARKAQPGQFIILRIDDEGERIPLTIAGYDREAGTITIIFQLVGATTRLLNTLNVGDELLDFVGPLGKASEFEGMHNVAVVGGGLGVAIAYPQAKALHDMGAVVDLIVGFRNEKLIILADEFEKACTNLFVMTDDGSNGHKGFVTQALEERLKAGVKYDAVIAIGPLMMMKAVSEMTRPYGIKTIVSMNSVMIDGTGMCGGCRVIVGGKPKFACVDGPDFDGHEVDFDSALKRGRMFLDEEKKAVEAHECRLTGGIRNA